MNTLLMSARPKDTTKEEWLKAWTNATFLLQPLADVLKNRLQALDMIKEEDFAIANHYALLAFREGKKAELQFLLVLLPDSVEK